MNKFKIYPCDSRSPKMRSQIATHRVEYGIGNGVTASVGVYGGVDCYYIHERIERARLARVKS